MTMKRRRGEVDGGDAKRARKEQRVSDSRVTELLRACLLKVCELQADLARRPDSDSEEDPGDAEAAGYAACALETVRFLTAEGLAPDHPVMKGLAQKLLRNHDR